MVHPLKQKKRGIPNQAITEKKRSHKNTQSKREEEEKKNGAKSTQDYIENNKIIDVILIMSLITSNVNGLNKL